MVETPHHEPVGFTNRTRGLSGEYAHEQGWQLFEDERRIPAIAPPDVEEKYPGREYDWGAPSPPGDKAVRSLEVGDESERDAA
ncbi:hypothetical protein FTW19_25130 [Terriglobus albidus]|uniref:Uncharacterized protein n=1 Tax=Terriglobus albidus TaxID=1592106 RepID=A0A5B9EKQ3_9BACT|nr:hypothetical protein [Terriglobus albidus]QEE30997.1 hypothetical protein FTW19_25130 [Terriglobus albidus]